MTKNRKVFIIGHRLNNLKKPVKALKQGVNGIEVDVWHGDGKWHVSHDGIIRQDLDDWLKVIAKLSKQYNEQFALIVFDIKSKASIVDLRNKINNYLPADLNKVYSVPKVSEAGIFIEIANDLSNFEMLSVDHEEDPIPVDSFFRSINFKRGLYGNGIDALLLSFENFHKDLKRAGEMRDSDGSFFKTYTWTIERKVTIRKYLTHSKVDGILVNLNSVFKKPVRRALKICMEEGLVIATRSSLNKELEEMFKPVNLF